MIANWKPRLFSNLVQHATTLRRRIAKRPAVDAVEILEERCVLTPVSWISANDGFWDDGSNWSSGQAPGSGDDVTIDVGSFNPIITVRDNRSVNSLLTREFLIISNAQFQVNSTSQIDASTTTLVSGGLVAAGTLTVSNSGVLDWQGGNISGNGLVNTGTITITGAADRTVSALIVNQGLVIHSGSGDIIDVASGQGSRFENQLGAVYDFQGDDGRVGISNFNNAGTVRKSAGSGESRFSSSGGDPNAVSFNNLGGTIEALTGTLRLSRGNSTSGTFHVEASGVVDLTGSATPRFQGLFTGSGTGRVELSSGGINIDSTGATFSFDPGVMHWTGGGVFSGGALTNVGTLQISGSTDKAIAGLIINQGTVIDSGSGDVVDVGSGQGSRFENQAGAVFDFQGDDGWVTISTFNNAGTVRKSAGTGESRFVATNGDPNGSNLFNNLGGTIESVSGTLRLARGTSTGGIYNASAGGVVDLTGGGSATFSGTYTGSGTGRVELASGQIVTNETGAIFNFPVGLLQWTGGGIAGNAGFNNVGQMTISGPGSKGLSGNGFVNSGTIINVGAGEFGLGGFALTNAATGVFEQRGDSPFTGTDQFGNAGRFINNGLFHKSTGTGTVSFTGRWENSPSGIIDVDAGRMGFARGGTSTGGTFNVSSGAVLEFTGSDVFDFGGTYTGTGPGRIEFNSLLRGNEGGNPANLNFPEGLFHLIGGQLLGNIVNVGWFDFAPTSGLFARAQFINDGTFVHSGVGDLVLNANSRFINQGLYDLRTDADLVVPGDNSFGTMFFVNPGLFRKSAGLGTSAFRHDGTSKELRFSNTGTVEALSGTLSLNDAVDQVSGTTLTAGTWKAGSFSTLTIPSSGNITTNAGSVILDGTEANFTNITALATNRGELSLQGGRDFTTTGSLTNSGHITVGPGSVLTVNGTFIESSFSSVVGWWRGENDPTDSAGTLEGTEVGTVNYAPGQFGSAFSLDGERDFINLGNPTALRLQDFTISAYVKRDDLTKGGLVLSYGQSGFGLGLTAEGRLILTQIGISGIDSGNLQITDTSFHHIAVTKSGSTVTFYLDGVASDAIVYRPTFSFFTNASIGARADTNEPAFLGRIDEVLVFSRILNAQEIQQLGTTNNVLTLGQSVPQINVEISGTSGTNQFGRIATTGAATLAGNLNIVGIDGFTAPSGDHYTIMTYPSKTGSFSNISGITGLYNVDVGTTQIELTSIANPTDLMVTSVSVLPAAAQPGDNLTVTYTVSNLNDVATSGEWIDSLYLSRDGVYSADDTLLGRVTHVGGVQALAGYTATQTLPLTAVLTGDYKVIVITNSRGMLAESNRSNNSGASNQSVSVSYPTLQFDTTTQATIANGQERYYRLEVPAQGDVILTATFAAPNQAEFFVSYQQLPTRSEFDFVANDPAELIRKITMASPQAGTYYILVHGSEGAGTGQQFSITPTHIALGINAVSPAKGSNLGTVTFEILGSGFTPESVLELVDDGGQLIRAAQSLFYVSPNKVLATFDLTGVTANTYNLRVTQPGGGGVSILDDGVQVIDGLAGQLAVTISSPGRIRPGRQARALVEYTNVGNTDLVAPLLLVSASNSLIKLPSQTSYVRDRIMLLGINPSGLAGVLPPSASGKIYLDFIPSGTSTFTVTSLEDGTAPIDISVLKNETKPFGMPQEAWDAVYANFQSDTGGSWGSLREMLARNASHLSQFGSVLPDVGRLIGSDLARADNFGEMTRRNTVGAFGGGWADGADVKILIDPSGNPTVVAAGTARGFIKRADGTYVPARPGDTGQLTFTSNHFVLRNSDGFTLTFRTDNRLDYVEDLNGNRVSLGYTGNQLTTITDSFGSVITYTYNTQGRVSTVSAPGGQLATYTYDSTGTRLMSVTDATGTLNYGYVTGQGPTQDGALASISTGNEQILGYTYDSRGRVETSQRYGEVGPTRYDYDLSSALTVTDPLGRETVGLFNELGELARLFEPGGQSPTAELDAVNGGIDLLMPGSGRWTTEYDDLGNAVLLRNPLGHTIEARYNQSFNSIELFRDQRGNTITYSYDTDGNLTGINYPDGSQFQFGYDGQGRTIRQTNRRGQSVLFFYNTQNQLIRKEFPDGSKIEFDYDAQFRVEAATRTQGATVASTHYGYNSLNQVISVTDADNRTLNFTYDAAGRRKTLTGPDGLTQKYFYNAQGKLSQITDGNDNNLVGYLYDAAGRTTRVNQGNGLFTLYTYNDLDQITSIVNHAADASVLSSIAYTYNSQHLVASATTPDGTTQYLYDALGQLKSVALPGGRTITYEYDPTGNRIRAVDSGVTTNSTVNILNETLTAGATTYTYDTDGNLATKTDAGGTTTYAYDFENRLISVTSSSDTWLYGYDIRGNRTSVTHNGVQSKFVFDFSGAPIAEYGTGGLVANYFSGQGLAGRRDASGVDSFYHFDVTGNVTELINGTGGIVNSYQYLPFGEKTVEVEGVSNPFTYVGQLGVMDSGDGTYWMQNRNYSPELGKFLSADPSGVEGNDANFYRYGANSPITQVDPNGLNTLEQAILQRSGEILAHVSNELQQTVAATGRYVESVRGAGTYMGSSLADPTVERYAKYGLESLERQIERAKGFANYKVSPEVAEAFQNALTKAQSFLEKGRPVLEKIREGEAAIARLATREAAKNVTEEIAEQATKQISREVVEQGAKTGLTKLAARGLLKILANPYVAAADVGWGIGTLARYIPGVDSTALEFANWVSYGTTHPSDPYNNFGPRAFDLFDDGWKSRGSSTSGEAVSMDPNDIFGPAGFGAAHFITPNQTMPYTVLFENKPEATAPAQEVFITQQLDTDLDWSTFELGDFGFGDLIIDVPDGRNFYHTQVDLTASQGFIVDVTAGINATTGVVTWTFTTLDPTTGDLVADALAGFLPPNDSDHAGEGFVEYSVRPLASLTTGATINAQASIIFDTNAPLLTPTYVNTIDTGNPTSSVTQLAPTQDFASFQVRWSGTDDVGGPTGSGIALYDIYVSDNGAAFTPFLLGTTQTSATFSGQVDHSYSFFSVATDNVGHEQPTPASGQTFTQVLNVLFDFGDAPDPVSATAGHYPTLLANDGARHQLGGGLFLGSGVDSDSNGQPNVTATGDDLAGTTDDEDGVVFGNLVRGTMGTATVTASGVGKLDAWIDFNRDGDWSDAGEQIATSVALHAGSNDIAFAIPSDSLPATSFTRFRFSSTGGLSFSGSANDGEVEDYQIALTAPLLNQPGPAVTWVKKNPPVIVLPQITVSDGNLANGTLTVSMVAAGSKRKSSDLLSSAAATSIGTSTGFQYAGGKLTLQVQFNATASATDIQNFLRSITFSTKGKGLRILSRSLTVTLSNVAGQSTAVSQTIQVRKK